MTALAITAFAALSQGASAGPNPIQVRFGGDANATRIVIDVDHAIDARVVSTSRGAEVVLDFPRLGADAATGRGQGLVGTWSLEKAGSGSRLKLSLKTSAAIDRRFLLAPGDGVDHYRYVIDLKASNPTPVVARANTPAPKAPVPAPAPPPKAAKRVIVIDPGHGGRDPGTLGQNAHEKDVTLSAARALKARLEATGRYTVVMTRTSDVLIPLDERVQIARRADADLFISLHADAGANAATKGASVYTLSDKGSTRAARSQGLNGNWGSGSAPRPAVRDILFDLTQRSTRNKSAVFAEMLIAEVGEVRPLLTRAHRDNDYVVLFAPDVPAVLLEMGFMSNSEDEAQLRDPGHRDRLVAAIARSIDDYFEQNVVTASL